MAGPAVSSISKLRDMSVDLSSDPAVAFLSFRVSFFSTVLHSFDSVLFTNRALQSMLRFGKAPALYVAWPKPTSGQTV